MDTMKKYNPGTPGAERKEKKLTLTKLKRRIRIMPPWARPAARRKLIAEGLLGAASK